MSRYSDQIDTLIERLEGELRAMIVKGSETGNGEFWSVKFSSDITAITNGIETLKRLKADEGKGGEREPMPVIV